MGYKLGLADRNTAINSSLFVGGILYALWGRPRSGGRSHPSRRRYLGPWLLVVLLMALDGGSHLVSELTGWGFRLDNAWLRAVTGTALPNALYVGDGLGSFNWPMRTLTGALMGLTTAWLVLPILRKGFEERPAKLEENRIHRGPSAE